MALVQSISPNANCAVSRETQVQTQACRLRETLNLLNERLVELGCRIEPILLNESACNGEEIDPPQDHLVPLAEDYRNNRQQVEAMIARVDSYLNRLEL